MSGASDALTTSISQWPGREGSAMGISPILTSVASALAQKTQEMSSAVVRRIMAVRIKNRVCRVDLPHMHYWISSRCMVTSPDIVKHGAIVGVGLPALTFAGARSSVPTCVVIADCPCGPDLA